MIRSAAFWFAFVVPLLVLLIRAVVALGKIGAIVPNPAIP